MKKPALGAGWQAGQGAACREWLTRGDSIGRVTDEVVERAQRRCCAAACGHHDLLVGRSRAIAGSKNAGHVGGAPGIDDDFAKGWSCLSLPYIS